MIAPDTIVDNKGKYNWVRVKGFGEEILYEDPAHPKVFRVEDPADPNVGTVRSTGRHGHHHRVEIVTILSESSN